MITAQKTCSEKFLLLCYMEKKTVTWVWDDIFGNKLSKMLKKQKKKSCCCLKGCGKNKYLGLPNIYNSLVH